MTDLWKDLSASCYCAARFKTPRPPHVVAAEATTAVIIVFVRDKDAAQQLEKSKIIFFLLTKKRLVLDERVPWCSRNSNQEPTHSDDYHIYIQSNFSLTACFCGVSRRWQIGSRDPKWCVCKLSEYQDVLMEIIENERQIWCKGLIH